MADEVLGKQVIFQSASAVRMDAIDCPGANQYCSVGFPVHVFQRVNNRQTLFTSNVDLAAFAHWLGEGVLRR